MLVLQKVYHRRLWCEERRFTTPDILPVAQATHGFESVWELHSFGKTKIRKHKRPEMV